MSADQSLAICGSQRCGSAVASCRILFVVSFLASSQSAFSIVGLPHHALATGSSASQLSALLSALPLATALCSAFAGPVSDFIGRGRMLVAGLGLLGGALLLHPLADSFASLLAARAIVGIACGMLLGLPAMYLSDNFAPSQQRDLLGKSLSGYALGHTLGVPLGMLAIDRLGFLNLNGAIGILCALAAVVAAFTLNTRPPSATPLNFARRLAQYAAETKVSVSSSRLKLLAAISFSSFVATSAFYVSATLFFYQDHAFTPANLAPMYFVAGIAQTFAMTPRCQRAGNLESRSLIAWSFAATAVAVGAFGLASLDPWFAFSFFAVAAATIAWRIPSFQHLVNQSGPVEQKGLRVSFVQTSNHLGKALGASALVGLSTGVSIPLALGVCALVLALCGLAATRLKAPESAAH